MTAGTRRPQFVSNVFRRIVGVTGLAAALGAVSVAVLSLPAAMAYPPEAWMVVGPPLVVAVSGWVLVLAALKPIDRGDDLLEEARSLAHRAGFQRLDAMPAWWGRVSRGCHLEAVTPASPQLCQGDAEGIYGLMTMHGPVDTASGRMTAKTALAWTVVDAPYERVDLVSTRIDPRLGAYLAAPSHGAAPQHLSSAWHVVAPSLEAGAAALTPSVVDVLNAVEDKQVNVRFDGNVVIAWADANGPEASADTLLAAVGGIARTHGRTEAPYGPAKVRHLSATLTSDRWCAAALMAGFTAVVAAWWAVVFLVAGLPTPERPALAGCGPATAGIAAGVALLSASVVAVAAWRLRILKRRAMSAATEINRVAAAGRLLYVRHERGLESGWGRAPFGNAGTIAARPSASAARPWGRIGASYIEADVKVGPFHARTMTSRVVWAELLEPLPAVTLLREGFATALAKACGGRDLDVESYAFNRLWRVRADHPREAHALLQPIMIDLLVRTADEGISFHLDGHRVVLWDDGRDASIDLTRRFELIEAFVKALPSFMRRTRNQLGPP